MGTLKSIAIFVSVGIINRFLSNHWLVIFSRISYAVYLTQFAVFFYNVGTTRYSTEFQLHRAVSKRNAHHMVLKEFYFHAQ